MRLGWAFTKGEIWTQRQTNEETQGDHKVKIKAETGGLRLQIKERPRFQKTRS